MSDRKPSHAHYDAVVDLATSPERGLYGLALVKQTYRLTPRGAVLDAPEPLLHDLRDEKQSPRLVPGTDFWPTKALTDIVVEGSAFAPRGVPVQQMTVTATVGNRTKRVAVFGRRAVAWSERGAPRFGTPEPFTEVPLAWEAAYGGIDWRVEDPAARSWRAEVLAAALAVDHPGLYPRNPFGKGYLVDPDPLDGVELPQMEDPEDLLTPDRLLVRDPRAWYRQPMPWGLGWAHPMMFPRYAFSVLGPDAWFPGPEDAQLPEVRRGYLVAGYRSAMAGRALTDGPAPRFVQGASHGLIFAGLEAGTPVRITGMHPELDRVEFALPPPPAVVMQVEGRTERVATRLHSVVCRPADGQFYVLYGATMPVQRPLIPGIHKHIPIAASVNGDPLLRYEAPVPIRDRIAEAMAKPPAAP